jgi:hypothetical protein
MSIVSIVQEMSNNKNNPLKISAGGLKAAEQADEFSKLTEYYDVMTGNWIIPEKEVNKEKIDAITNLVKNGKVFNADGTESFMERLAFTFVPHIDENGQETNELDYLIAPINLA